MSDYPRPVILQKAATAIRDGGGPDLVRVFYKWTCRGCGARNMAKIPNELPQVANCDECGLFQLISSAGYALHMRKSTEIPWDDSPGNVLFITRRPDQP